jgi:membrane associated rhomboid family serine protease
MPTCDVCGKQVDLPYNCNECGGTFCSSHRLPENHDCPGLKDWGDPDGVFDSGFDSSVGTAGSEDSGSFFDRLSRPGGPLGYFRGNMTFVFLAAMWITFLIQKLMEFVLLPSGAPIGTSYGIAFSETYRSIFTLTSAHPEYVWTWFTSIFSHGGFFHIAFNSIVIFFFGRIVEEYIGSRDFAILFLVSGAIAGLGQIALNAATGGGYAAVLGASGAALAVMGVLTVLNPNLTVYLYFLLPVPIWVLTIGFAAISALGVLSPGSGGVAQGAHLVGLVLGVVYGQYVKDKVDPPRKLQFGGGPGGPGGPGGGRRRGPF